MILNCKFFLHLMSYIAQHQFMEHMFQNLPFYCTKKVLKYPQSILSILSQGWNSLPGACSDLDLPKSWLGLWPLHELEMEQSRSVFCVRIYLANFLSLCRLLRSFVGYTVHRTLTLFYVFNKQDNASNKQENLKRVGKYVDSVFIFSYLYKTRHIGPVGSIPSPCYLCPLANLLLYCHYF